METDAEEEDGEGEREVTMAKYMARVHICFSVEMSVSRQEQRQKSNHANNFGGLN